MSTPEHVGKMIDLLADDLDDMRGQDENGQNYRIGTAIVRRVRAVANQAREIPSGEPVDRVTELFEKWAAEEDEHRKAGASGIPTAYGIAEGLRIASDDLRAALGGLS